MSKHRTTLRDVMTEKLVMLAHDRSAADAAREMRKANIGNVLITKEDKLCGIVTDRDLVVRCMAAGAEPEKVELGTLCSKDPVALAPDAAIEDAVSLMRKRAVRRVPVVDGDKPVGVVSIGDLAIRVDRSSALRDISAAQPNR